MKSDREYERRQAIAERIAKETGVMVEAIHPAGPIGYSYVVGPCREGARDARDARRIAARAAE